jgi:hypothetical protein
MDSIDLKINVEDGTELKRVDGKVYISFDDENETPYLDVTDIYGNKDDANLDDSKFEIIVSFNLEYSTENYEYGADADGNRGENRVELFPQSVSLIYDLNVVDQDEDINNHYKIEDNKELMNYLEEYILENVQEVLENERNN